MSYQHLISPYSYTAQSFIKVMRIKEMIINQDTSIVNWILLVSTNENV